MATAQQTGADLEMPSALRTALARIVRRLWYARLLRLVSRGAFAATCLSLMAVGLAHAGLLPSWLRLEFLLPFLLLLGIGLGTLSAIRLSIDPMTAARLAESRLGLKERLSSALDFERTGMTPSDPEAALLLRLQGQDAVAHAQSLHPDEVAPLRLFWETKAFLAVLLVLLLALLLPTLPIFVPPAVRAERAVVQRSGEELARTARLIEKNADADGLPATKRAAQDMQKLGEQMSQGRMDKKQAMVQMARLSKQMAGEQRRLARAGGPDAQSLTPAGRQLAQSLAPSASGQAANTQGQTASPTPEVQRAARALQRDSRAGLSEQLRGLAQKAASGPMSPGTQRQTAQDLQKLSDALKGTSLSDAGKHARSAADALRHGDPQRAASEMRQAADAADRRVPQQDAQGVQDAQKSLQDSQQQMAQAANPADIPHAPGQAAQGGASKASGRQPENGRPGSAGQSSGGSPRGGVPGSLGAGKSMPTKPGSGRDAHGGASGRQASAPNAGVARGAPHPLNPKSDLTKNPGNGRILLGAGDGAAGKQSRSQSGAPPAGEPHGSSVPYDDSLAPARKTAETAMDKEDIPPAYRGSVRRYFDALQPPAGTSK